MTVRPIIAAAAPALLAAELTVLGAALKILIGGGSKLSDAQMKRASGATDYIWRTKGAAIRTLVADIERAGGD